MALTLVVLIRILSNPISNVFQKILTRRQADPLFVIFITHGWISLACLLILLAYRRPVSAEFWFNISIVTLLTVFGNALLIQAVKLSDLSVLGPVNAYKAIISLIPGMILLHEFPHALGLSGMALIVAGSYFIVDKSVTRPGRNVFVRFFTDRGIQYRFAAMTLAAIEAAFLKQAVLLSNPIITFSGWAILGFVLAGLVVLLTRSTRLRHNLRIIRSAGPTSPMLGASVGLMQFCTIVALQGFQVGYALALFQTSTLISVFLGYKVFKEKNILERLLGSLIMIAGAILIIMER